MKKYWFLLLAPLILLLWWGFARRDSQPVVHLVSTRIATIESTVPTNGKVEPNGNGAARAEVAGVVRSVLVQRGQTVGAGQVLVALDTTAAESALAEALAREEDARAQLSLITRGGRPSAVATLDDSLRAAQAATAAAQRNYESLQRLAEQGAATKLQVEDAKDALTRANLQVEAYQNQRKTLVTESDRQVAQAKLEDAQAAVKSARHQLELGRIRSPLAGTVYQFDLKVGAYLQPGDLVAQIGDLDRVKVTVYVDEPELGRVSANLPVLISWDAGSSQELRWWGRVEKLPTQVVALGTRTVGEVTTVVDNPNHNLLPGVTVNATIISKVAKDALAIPKAALRSRDGSPGVFKWESGVLLWTPVQTGVSDVNLVQIVSGLQSGDKVMDRVVDPSDAEIRSGMHARSGG